MLWKYYEDVAQIAGSSGAMAARLEGRCSVERACRDMVHTVLLPGVRFDREGEQAPAQKHPGPGFQASSGSSSLGIGEHAWVCLCIHTKSISCR